MGLSKHRVMSAKSCAKSRMQASNDWQLTTHSYTAASTSIYSNQPLMKATSPSLRMLSVPISSADPRSGSCQESTANIVILPRVLHHNFRIASKTPNVVTRVLARRPILITAGITE